MGRWTRTDKSTGEEEPITEAEVIRKLTGVYKNIDTAIQAAREGRILQSSYAYYAYDKYAEAEVELDNSLMVLVLTRPGFIRWAEGKSIQITDVKLEYRETFASNFVQKIGG